MPGFGGGLPEEGNTQDVEGQEADVEQGLRGRRDSSCEAAGAGTGAGAGVGGEGREEGDGPP